MKTEIRKLISTAKNLNEIIEGIRSEDWRNKDGRRFKDTPEWCQFFVALKMLETALASAPEGEIPKEQRNTIR